MTRLFGDANEKRYASAVTLPGSGKKLGKPGQRPDLPSSGRPEDGWSGM